MKNEYERTLWVTSISPAKIFGDSYVPSVLLYGNDNQLLIGSSALAQGNQGDVTKNFKLDLGEIPPGGSPYNRKMFKTSKGDKSAFEITQDFFNTFLAEIENKYPRSESTGHKHPAKIIVAEPLAFQVEGLDKSWITNYRANIKRILDRYEQVEFLPEPFAVYQYYRYGLRLPALQEKSKKVALILDFGGGTFDACVIESTSKGDVSQTGKMSKPLSADSIPVGGHYINRCIAKYLIKRYIPDNKKGDADRYFTQYERCLKGELNVDDLRPEFKVFINNYEEIENNCERYKLALASQFTASDWDLNKEIYHKVIVSLPKDPFKDGEWFEDEFWGHNLRDLFINEIWNKKLIKIIKSVIQRAKDALDDRHITLTLVSGGSSNLRWLISLLKRDFSGELSGAEPVPVDHSFQEVVANGLAIECARRFYDPDSEFVSVTYNPVKLYLNPDEKGIDKSRSFRSVGDRVDMHNAKPGDLVPSAQSLSHFFDRELLWKVKLASPPKRQLEYFFTRPEAGEDEHYDAYNVEQTRLFTSDPTNFDQQILVSLTVRKDGTTTPKFIYKSANEEFGVQENSEVGREFYLDMTAFSEVVGSPQFFVGFDFGTSNSSACLLTQDQIEIQKQRQNDPEWQGLSTCVSYLPYPVSISLRRFLSETNASEIANTAREVFESALAYMAYVAASEASALGNPISLKSFQHRSMGPLKSLLEQALNKLGNKAKYSLAFKQLLLGERLNLLDQAITNFNNHKHHKVDAQSINWQDYVELVCKIVGKASEDFQFGYCATCNPNPDDFDGTFTGKFVIAHDNAPFVNSFTYESNKSVQPSIAILKGIDSKEAISLTPFIFWESSGSNVSDNACCWIDKKEGDEILVKICSQSNCLHSKDVNPGIDKAAKKLFETGSTVYGNLEIVKI